MISGFFSNVAFALGLFLLPLLFVGSNASAQIYSGNNSYDALAAPINPIKDLNGVDLNSGRLQYPDHPLSIGNVDSGISGNFYWGVREFSGHISIVKMYSGDNMERYTLVTLGKVTDLFLGDPGSDFYRPKSPHGQSLRFIQSGTPNEGIYIYTTKDGTVVTYDTTIVDGISSSDIYGNDIYAKNTYIQYPNGKKIKVNYYYSATYKSWTPSSIESNEGWMLKYDLEELNAGEYKVSKVSAVNLSSEPIYCDKTAMKCDFALSWPYVKYVYDIVCFMGHCESFVRERKNSNDEGIIDGYIGRCSSKIGTNDNIYAPHHLIVTLPSGINTDYCIDFFERVQSVSKNGETWTYNYSLSEKDLMHLTSPGGAGVSVNVVRPEGSQMGISSQYVEGNLCEIFNGIDRVNYGYDPLGENTGLVYVISYPGGNKIYFNYDKRGNITERREVAKPNAGLSDLVWTASYDAACNNPKICNKPNWTRDPKGNQTDYTYSAEHGGVLTETEPADSNGVRPQKRYAYAPFYAKVLNSSGALVNAEGPIYKLIKVSTCKIAIAVNPASCVGTADETVTEYAYENNNLLLSSETVHNGDNSLSSTNSYEYDQIGNLVSVDGPLVGTFDKAYTTYDANRRIIFEIGVDPDGVGPIKRTILKHTYNGDGNETRTEFGSGNAIDGSDFVVTNFKRMTYDTSGRLVKTEEVLP